MSDVGAVRGRVWVTLVPLDLGVSDVGAVRGGC